MKIKSEKCGAVAEQFLRETPCGIGRGCGFSWLDTGTMESLLDAANYVEMIQSRQGIMISAPEEIAYINGFIGREKLMESAKAYGKSPYGEHLKAVAESDSSGSVRVNAEGDELLTVGGGVGGFFGAFALENELVFASRYGICYSGN